MYKINNCTTKVFMDLEFTKLDQSAKLISIALISENGKALYVEVSDYNKSKTLLDAFIVTNVEANLLLLDKPEGTSVLLPDNVEMYKDRYEKCKEKIFDFFSNFDYVEIWGDCLAYDWVIFCQLFGGALNIPKNIYYIPFDISTFFKINNIDPDVSREEFIEESINFIPSYITDKKHNSLFNTFVIRECYNKLDKK